MTGEARQQKWRQARQAWRDGLHAKRLSTGHWEGKLATSALSTAVALVALLQVDEKKHRHRIKAGIDWLTTHANQDGGWGDTIRSHSNLSTTALCWGALKAVDGIGANAGIEGAEAWLRQHLGGLSPDEVAEAILARYAEDRTFSVPILMMLAVCGCLGKGRQGWKKVMPLPFELAALPRGLYAAARMPVVSYALPALIAIGQTIYYHRGAGNPLSGLLRKWTRKRTLQILDQIQPENGGFLEAVPLTGFVTMSLAAMGQTDLRVVQRGVNFLCDQQREDGSWPIDTHLATWVTTLATNGLLYAGEDAAWSASDRSQCRQWLLDQQYAVVHPYTGAAPGGWAWTPLPGGVPDGDDTSGAILALAKLDDGSQGLRKAASAGLDWLAGLQNRDGGIPTFCRGWGTLPFDQSCPDISAHTLQAIATWHRRGLSAARWQRLGEKALKYLLKVQRADGTWLPLWFGNQHHAQQHNPTYGTARVLLGLEDAGLFSSDPALLIAAVQAGCDWLAEVQDSRGSWGGDRGLPATVEETALAVAALALHDQHPQAVRRGLDWLATQQPDVSPSPIGFYFANLWYFEDLYPATFTVLAFEVAKAKGYLE